MFALNNWDGSRSLSNLENISVTTIDNHSQPSSSVLGSVTFETNSYVYLDTTLKTNATAFPSDKSNTRVRC